MSEFSISSTTSKKTHFSSLLLSDLLLFCSFILSHPLYFFYFIFFSPYLFRFLSFLSPLFITTFLLLLVFLTVSPNLVHDNLSTELSESKVSFLLGTYQTVVERLRSKVEEHGNPELNQFEELEVYKIVFDTSDFDIGENPIQVLESDAKENCLTSDATQVKNNSSSEDSGNENLVVITRSESSQLIAEAKPLGVFLHQKEEFEELASKKEAKDVKPLSSNFNKVESEQKEEPYMRSGSKAMGYKLRDAKISADDGGECLSRMNSQKLDSNPWSSPDNGGEYNSKAMNNSQTMGANLGSFGSMRKEKEWRRTLACKLFEERHNADGGEGMDMLWETYETDSIKVQGKSKSKKGKKGNIERHHDDDVDDEDEDELSNGQLCCLQALKFSAGKMSLGMGRPNLVKISKALKGIGWLHHVTKGKKGYR
ncbi:uncharacterized protein LOC8279038 [Ricinus communis]|uniref:Uncharacterized protein n=1 Tax=Ricinus communis TaxID=3988 RepID=B9T3B6_RICCO|nr:uncharacterized protein LOC8279038 [Ricinus communis]EEF29637.1 hypothetical protein RCOM_1749890 [Ricinus communis]|eukprot:XP_002532735.1 uncharacterized protein LOC8279038 [Ricinus communis]